MCEQLQLIKKQPEEGNDNPRLHLRRWVLEELKLERSRDKKDAAEGKTKNTHRRN